MIRRTIDGFGSIHRPVCEDSFRGVARLISGVGDREEYLSALEDDQDQLHNRFPGIVFRSTLLMACALFEGSLLDLCKSLERALPTPAPLTKIKDSGITKSAVFLKKNFGIYLSNHPGWGHVLDYFKVRDCVVHADGDISKMKPDQADRIRRVVERYGSTGLSMTHGHLNLGQDFVAAVIDDLGAVWPPLGAACIDNEVVGPHYWP
jgi:hypothetical protein